MKQKIYVLILCVLLSTSYAYAQTELIRTVNVTVPGTLNDLLGADKPNVTQLIITGTINDVDFKTIRETSVLKILNIKNANVIGNKLPAMAFYLKQIDEISLPTTLESTGNQSFHGLKVNKMVLPSGLRKIDNLTFYCTSIDGIDFSNCHNIDTIAGQAFYGAQGTELNLTSFTSLKFIGWGAFNLSTAKVILPEHLTSTFPYGFLGVNGNVILPKGITTIAEASFAESIMSELYLPEGVKDLGSQVFQSSNIKKLTLPSTISYIPMFAFVRANIDGVDFSKCQNVTKIGTEAFKDSKVTTLDLSHLIGLEITSDNVFYNMSASAIILPPNLSNIGHNNFKDCVNLKSLTVHNPIPAQLGGSVFAGIDQPNCELRVPKGSAELYKAAEQWKEFKIVEFTPILNENLVFEKASGENLHQVEPGEEFAIYANADYMYGMSIGLYNSNGSFIEDIVTSANGNTFSCKISEGTLTGSNYIIQPYIEYNGEKHAISRVENSHIIDRIRISVNNEWWSKSARTGVADTDLNNHLLIQTSKADWMQVAVGQQFKVNASQIIISKDTQIGLFDALTGELVANVTKTVSGNVFTCEIPSSVIEATYNLIPYQTVDSQVAYVNRNQDAINLVDRLPISVTTSVATKSAYTDVSTVSLVSVYPNPTTNILYIDSKKDILQVEVYNATSGHKVLSVNKAISSIDMSNVAKGVYVVKVKTASGVETHKVIKQ